MADLRFSRWTPDDLVAAIAWYESKSSELGIKFRVEADATFDAIANHPLRHSRMDGDLEIRCARVGRFPYYVYFQIVGDVIFILGIRHGATNPAMLLRRATEG